MKCPLVLLLLITSKFRHQSNSKDRPTPTKKVLRRFRSVLWVSVSVGSQSVSSSRSREIEVPRRTFVSVASLRRPVGDWTLMFEAHSRSTCCATLASVAVTYKLSVNMLHHEHIFSTLLLLWSKCTVWDKWTLTLTTAALTSLHQVLYYLWASKTTRGNVSEFVDNRQATMFRFHIS